MGLRKSSLFMNSNGTVYFPRTNWDDLRFPATGINPPGASTDPAVDPVDGCFVFSKTATNVIAGVAQMPHAWKLGSQIEAHIHWEIPADTNGTVLWRFEYASADLMGLFPSSYTAIDVPVVVDTYSVRQHIVTTLGMFSVGSDVSCCIKWKLSRIGGDGADTYDNTAKLLEFDIHYEIDALGSGQERIK